MLQENRFCIECLDFIAQINRVDLSESSMPNFTFNVHCYIRSSGIRLYIMHIPQSKCVVFRINFLILQVQQSQWVASPADRSRFIGIFQQNKDASDNLISGAAARNVFVQSGLPQNILAHVW